MVAGATTEATRAVTTAGRARARPGLKAPPRERSGTSARARPARARPVRSPSGKTAVRTVRPERRARPRAEGAPTEQRRRASAGRILAVGLICFLVWLLFDANQLYHSAQAGQIGVRRTVAVIVLRPIAAITDALRISGPVNAADSALGRCGIGGAPVCGNGPIPTTPPVTAPPQRPQGYLGLGAAPHLGPGIRYIPPPPPPVVPPGPPALVSPTASRPLTLLSIGDSIGEDLGFGLGDVFSTDPAVRVVQEGLEDTGLARTDYYNWPATLAVDLHRYRPKIVVVMLGANDAQALYVSGTTYLPFGTPSAEPAWWRVYTARVALVMQEATDAGAHVMWVGLPPMGPGSTVPSWFPQQLNRVFYAQALSHPGVAYFSAAKVLSNNKGGFTEYMNIGGSELAVRSADGVHLLNAGYDLLAGDLVRPMERSWHVNLRVG